MLYVSIPRYNSGGPANKVLYHSKREVALNASVASKRRLQLCVTYSTFLFRQLLFQVSKSLFENFPVRPLICFPLDHDRLIPAPLVIDEFSVFGFAGIKLSDFVALVIWCDVKGRCSFLATDDKGSLDNRVILASVDRSAAKDVLAGTFETGEKSACRKMED